MLTVNYRTEFPYTVIKAIKEYMEGKTTEFKVQIKPEIQEHYTYKEDGYLLLCKDGIHLYSGNYQNELDISFIHFVKSFLLQFAYPHVYEMEHFRDKLDMSTMSEGQKQSYKAIQSYIVDLKKNITRIENILVGA